MKEMIRCETEKIVFKSANNLAPEYLSHLFIRNSDSNTISLRNAKTDLLVLFVKTSNGQKVIRGVKTWNEHSYGAKHAPFYLLLRTRWRVRCK